MKVNLFFHDDAYSPSDHPHAPAGSAKGGQFVRKIGGFTAATPSAAKNAVIKKLHMIVTGPGGEHAKADKLKEIASQQKAPIVASYANKLIAELEEAHAYDKGSLGKAVPKAGGEAAEKSAVNKSPTKMPEFTGSVTPLGQKKVDKAQVLFKAGDKNALMSMWDEYDHLGQSMISNYINKLLSALGENEPPTPTKVPDADLPKPHEASDKQKQLYEAAVDGSKTEAQIKAVQAISASGPMSEKYKAELLKALGHTEATEPAKPAPPPNPKKLTSQRPADQKLLEKFKTALDYTSHGGDVQKAIPTFHASAFTAFSDAQKSAMKLYTGSGYSPINKALRKPTEAHPETVNYVNLIDDAFEEDAARLTEDIVVRRGLGALANTPEASQAALENIKAGLKAGLPVKFSQRGFISTSIGGGFSAEINMKILLRKGTPAIYVGAISSHEGEKELLLRHGQQFRVVEYNEGAGGNHELTMVAEI